LWPLSRSKKKADIDDKKVNDIQWITVKGRHIPIKPGQSKDDAVKQFLKDDDKEPKFPKRITLNDGNSIFVDPDTGKQVNLPQQQKIIDKKEDERISKLDTVSKGGFFDGRIQVDKNNVNPEYNPEPHIQYIDEVVSDIPEKLTKFIKDIELTNNLGKESDPMAVANFNPRTKRIKINTINDEVEFKATLIHEIGHSYFEELPSEKKQEWKKMTKKPFTRYTSQFDQMIVDKFSTNPKLEIKKKAKEAFSELYHNEQFAEFTRITHSKKGRGEPGSSLEVLLSDDEINNIKKVYDKL
jgi:hypothetical protein